MKELRVPRSEDMPLGLLGLVGGDASTATAVASATSSA